MPFFGRLLCGSSNFAVNETAHRPAASFSCRDVSAVDQSAHDDVSPTAFPHLHILAYDDEKRQDKATRELTPVDATESAEESETELEIEYCYAEEESIDDDCSLVPVVDEDKSVVVYALSSLLGDMLVTNRASPQPPVCPDDALGGSAVVAIYYAAALQCEQTTRLLSIFAAGYEPASLAVVFCSADDDNAGFDAMPAHWWALPAASTSPATAAHRASLVDALDMVEGHPWLVIVDPATGRVRGSAALLEIAELDPAGSDYDERACEICQGWLDDGEWEQLVVEEIDIEYAVGFERTEYETRLPYSV